MPCSRMQNCSNCACGAQTVDERVAERRHSFAGGLGSHKTSHRGSEAFSIKVTAFTHVHHNAIFRQRLHNPHLYGISSIAQHRSEEHTSELQLLRHLVCRLLLEKKKS